MENFFISIKLKVFVSWVFVVVDCIISFFFGVTNILH